MKSFLVILKNKKRGELNKEHLLAHVEYLKKLKQSGNLIVCGPLLDNDRGIWILRASSRTDAEALITRDPFIEGRYYQDYECHEMLEANDDNNWLLESSQTIGNLR